MKIVNERYQLTKVLNQGEYCQTFLAQDIQNRDYECIIYHLPGLEQTSRAHYYLQSLFEQQVLALKNVSLSDRTPQLLDHFERNKGFYLVQEWIKGYPLSSEFRIAKLWSEKQVWTLLQDILKILEVIHSFDLIHREVTPSNIVRRSSDRSLFLTGFCNISQLWTEALNYLIAGKRSKKCVIGAPEYMPPEQEQGNPFLGSDIYALGIVALQALTGREPRQIKQDTVIDNIYFPAKVSEELAQVLRTMVKPTQRERYQDAASALAAIRYASWERDAKLETSTESFETHGATRVTLFSLGIFLGIATAFTLLYGSYYYLILRTNHSPWEVTNVTDAPVTSNNTYLS